MAAINGISATQAMAMAKTMWEEPKKEVPKDQTVTDPSVGFQFEEERRLEPTPPVRPGLEIPGEEEEELGEEEIDTVAENQATDIVGDTMEVTVEDDIEGWTESLTSEFEYDAEALENLSDADIKSLYHLESKMIDDETMTGSIEQGLLSPQEAEDYTHILSNWNNLSEEGQAAFKDNIEGDPAVFDNFISHLEITLEGHVVEVNEDGTPLEPVEAEETAEVEETEEPAEVEETEEAGEAEEAEEVVEAEETAAEAEPLTIGEGLEEIGDALLETIFGSEP